MLIRNKDYAPGISRTGTEFEPKRKIGSLEKITVLKGKVVFDIGCGLGGYSIASVNSKAKYVAGVDPSIDRLKKAKELVKSYDNIDLINAVAEYLPFKNNTGDIVLLVETIEHVNSEDECLSEIRRILRLKGTLLITAPNKFYLFETHGMRISKTKINSILGVGIPFLSWVPKKLRKRIELARIYSLKDIDFLLRKNGYDIFLTDCMMPSLDSLKASESLKFFIRIVFSRIEKVPFIRNLGSNLITVAKPSYSK